MKNQIPPQPGGTIKKKRITSQSRQEPIKRSGNYQVIIDKMVVGPFDNFYEAQYYGTGKYEVNIFMVQLLEGE